MRPEDAELMDHKRASQIESEADMKRDAVSMMRYSPIQAEKSVALMNLDLMSGDPTIVSKPQSSMGEPLRLPLATSKSKAQERNDAHQTKFVEKNTAEAEYLIQKNSSVDEDQYYGMSNVAEGEIDDDGDHENVIDTNYSPLKNQNPPITQHQSNRMTSKQELNMSQAQSTIELVRPIEMLAAANTSAAVAENMRYEQQRPYQVRSAQEITTDQATKQGSSTVNVLSTRNIQNDAYNSKSLSVQQVELLKEKLRSQVMAENNRIPL